MEQAAHAVHTIEVTRSVREADIDGIHVAAGQMLGIYDGQVVVATDSGDAALLRCFDHAPVDSLEIVTIYYGAGATDAEAQATASTLREAHPGLAVEVVHGGQPHYPVRRLAGMSVGIVTDSTADLPPAIQERYGVELVPLVVNWDGQTFRDKIDLTTAEFYRRLRDSKSVPKTGAPSLAAFEAAFREQLERHDAVVCVNVSAKLSATHDVARRAAEAVDPGRVRVVDSGSVSICMTYLIDQAGRLAQEGKDVAEIVERLEHTRERLRIYALLDTLEFLQRGGRIGRASAFLGGLLNVKPIIGVRDGEVSPVERVRTMKSALRRMVELVEGLGPLERLGVIDGDAAANAAVVDEQLRTRYPELTIDRGELGPVVGTHGGPGLVGVGVLLAG
jgi:DegV family protein with EDD domain